MICYSWKSLASLPLLLSFCFLAVVPAAAASADPARGRIAMGSGSLPSGSISGGEIDSTAVPAADSSGSVGEDIVDMGRVVIHVVGSPARWDLHDLAAAGLFLAANGGAVVLDDEVRDLVGRNHNAFNDAVRPTVNGYATVLYMGPAALGLYLTGVVADNTWIRRTGQMLVETVLCIGVIQVPLSTVLGRARPFLDEGNFSFKFFAGSNDDRASFFSGHSMVAFGFSTILSRQIDNRWASIGLYTLATAGALSRMYIDKHWFSDVLFGSIMGVLVGNTVHDWHMGGETPAGAWLHIVPSPGGLAVRGRF